MEYPKKTKEQEKARELFNFYWCGFVAYTDLPKTAAKSMAIKVVDEIIDALENHGYFEEEQYNFFVKVKEELELI
jgi:hypothetical protein